MASRKTPGSGGPRRSTTGEQPPAGPSELILYTTPDHQTRIEVRLEDETVWLSQRQLAELFQKSVPTVNEHIANVYDEGELDRDATIRKSRIVQTEGGREVSREVELYNLDGISHKMAVGVAGREFEKYDREQRRITAASMTDFDKAVDRIKKIGS